MTDLRLAHQLRRPPQTGSTRAEMANGEPSGCRVAFFLVNVGVPLAPPDPPR